MSSLKNKIKDIIERLTEEQQKAVLAFAQATLKEQNTPKDIGPINPKTTPKWADRTTGREVNAVDFIKTYYGELQNDGTWKPLEGLELKHIGNYDPQLYITYIQMTRRHPERDLGIPKESRSATRTPQEALDYLEEKRKKDRIRKRKNP